MKFAALFDIICDLRGPSEDRAAISSRVKQWQRIGVPNGVNVGRGTKVDYTPEMVWEVLLVNELTLLGFPAQTARDYMRRYWERVAPIGRFNSGVAIIIPVHDAKSSIVIDTGRIAAAMAEHDGR